MLSEALRQNSMKSEASLLSSCQFVNVLLSEGVIRVPVARLWEIELGTVVRSEGQILFQPQREIGLRANVVNAGSYMAAR